MAYTPEKPKLVPDSSVLKSTIKGWGVDLDPKDRPAVPKENFNPGGTGAHWEFPERQVPTYEREMTVEHKFLTPVFGTSCPPKGLSGAIRRLAYRRYSEGQSAHWLLLMLADRVDVFESNLTDVFRGKPDNFLAEYGIASEFKRHGLRSRLGRGRADTWHQPIELAMNVGKMVAVGAAVFALGRGVFRAGRALAGGGRKRRRGLWQLVPRMA